MPLNHEEILSQGGRHWWSGPRHRLTEEAQRWLSSRRLFRENVWAVLTSATRLRLRSAGDQDAFPPLERRPGRQRLAAVALLASIGLGSAAATITSSGDASAATADSALTMLLKPADAPVSTASALHGTQRIGPPLLSDAAPGGGRAKVRSGAPATGTGKASPSPAAKAAPATPAPVGGLSAVQMGYAQTIVNVGKQMGLPKQAYVVALATALQESKLYNLANWGSSDSLNLPHDGVGGDFDSVGLFQQRPSSGWGSVSELMTPATSARKFYQALEQVPGWQAMPVTVAAQTVQGSAFPDAYAQHEGLATLLANTFAP